MRKIALTLLIAAWPAMGLAQQAGDSSKGHDYATRVCAECHSVEFNGPASPNPAAPRFQAIANTPGMTEMALAAFLYTPHKSMPNLVIPTDAARDLIAYLLSLKRLPPA